MKIGPMRQRVTLQTATETPNLEGQPIPNWSDVGTYWASIRPATGRELANAAQMKSTLSHVITMRFVGVIDSRQRFVHNGRTFDITFIRNVDERNREYQIYAIEVVNPS